MRCGWSDVINRMTLNDKLEKGTDRKRVFFFFFLFLILTETGIKKKSYTFLIIHYELCQEVNFSPVPFFFF